MAGQEEVARLLLEAGAVCNEFTFDGDRCHYAALTPAIRALLRQFEQRPPPLAPLAAALRPLAPADGGAGAASAQLGCAACQQRPRGWRTAQALRQGAHHTRWEPRVSQGEPSGMRWERDCARGTCVGASRGRAAPLGATCGPAVYAPGQALCQSCQRARAIEASGSPAGSPAYHQGARCVGGRATEVACPADFAFVVAGERVELHRAVAAARAPLLRRQLLGPWAPQVQDVLGCHARKQYVQRVCPFQVGVHAAWTVRASSTLRSRLLELKRRSIHCGCAAARDPHWCVYKKCVGVGLKNLHSTKSWPPGIVACTTCSWARALAPRKCCVRTPH